ncbi:unnamed protein product, partial [Effrenium voratum]
FGAFVSLSPRVSLKLREVPRSMACTKSESEEGESVWEVLNEGDDEHQTPSVGMQLRASAVQRAPDVKALFQLWRRELRISKFQKEKLQRALNSWKRLADEGPLEATRSQQEVLQAQVVQFSQTVRRMQMGLGSIACMAIPALLLLWHRDKKWRRELASTQRQLERDLQQKSMQQKTALDETEQALQTRIEHLSQSQKDLSQSQKDLSQNQKVLSDKVNRQLESARQLHTAPAKAKQHEGKSKQ